MYRLTEEQKNKVKELLSKMTLEEKIGQMNQESVSIVGGFDVPFSELIEMMTDGRLSQEEFEKIMSTAEQDYHEDDIRAGLVGSLMVQDPVKCNELQKAAVEEGAATVMASFNDLNGVPCTVNRFTLRDVLKETYQFPGFVVSDANAIRECVAHGIAKDDADAGVQAAKAGMDVDMGTSIYKNELKKAVEEGRISEDVINEAAERILSVKMWLGLFEHPYVDETLMGRYEVLPKEHLELVREAGGLRIHRGWLEKCRRRI